MYTLSYHSQAKKPLSARQMEALLKQAQIFNKKHNITGCLIAYMNRFIQVLEGEEIVIKNLYEKIRVDRRHQTIMLFSEEDIKLRTFPNWGMAYYPVDDKVLNRDEFEQFKRNLTLLADLSPTTNVTALTFWKRMKFIISNPPEEL